MIDNEKMIRSLKKKIDKIKPKKKSRDSRSITL